jgi:flagellar hook-basal body complex protein FliE
VPDMIAPVGPGGTGPVAPIGAPQPPEAPTESEGVGGKSFSDFLSEKMGEVNNLQQQSDQAIQDLASGKVQDLSKVVSAVEKANLAFQMMIQIRNKLADAYDELRRMQM